MTAGRGLSRRGFLGAAGALAAGALLSACAPSTGGGSGSTGAAVAGKDFILPTDPEVAAAELARGGTGRTVRATLLAEDGVMTVPGSATALTSGYRTEAGLAALGPVLRASAGDRLRVEVDNRLEEATSVHWHGVRIRNDMDGSAPATQRPIAAGESFVYDFLAPDPGTHWYHSHSGLQADRGLLGALVIEDPADDSGAEVDHVIVLDDWLGSVSTPEAVLAALGGESAGHGHGDHADGAAPAGSGAAEQMVAQGTGDSALLGGPSQHIAYPVHLINGRAVDDPALLHAAPGARVRLRIVNAAAETPYRVALAGHAFTVIAADGFDTEPLAADAVLVAPAQRIDVLVTLRSGAWPLVAAVEGREGAALAVLRSDDAVGESPHGAGATALAELGGLVAVESMLRPHPRTLLAEREPEQLWRIELRQAGERYAWAVAGADAGVLHPRIGERVRIEMTNTSDMWHPMHLHGHSFALPAAGGLRRDTAMVLPGETVAIDIEADNPGQWMLHCHNAYHFEAGMTANLNYIR